jgi:hypothetical protein
MSTNMKMEQRQQLHLYEDVDASDMTTLINMFSDTSNIYLKDFLKIKLARHLQ